MYLQHDVGLADNGDFTRSMGWISSGPVGIEPNWPAAGTEDWSRRFFNYWIPYWELEWNISRPTTSAFLLWFPGALLNTFLYSSKVLFLPLLSLFPKLILFGVLLLLFKWIKLETRYRAVFLFSLGVPVIFLLTTTDYVAYLNSFYQEPASFVYLFLFLVSILLLRQRPSLPYLICSLASILLLATSKPANLYWPLIAIPFVFYAWSFKKNIRLRTAVVANLALITLFTFASALITKTGSIQANAYNSLFYGVLVFSDNPTEHLQDLEMNDAAHCIDTSVYSPTGSVCFKKYQDRLSFRNTIRVIYREPAVMFRMLKYALDTMQVVSLDYLGKYAFDDPRSQTSPPISDGVEERFWPSTAETRPLNLWAELKVKFFPTGYALSFVLIVFAIWFILSYKRTGIYQDLAMVGLISTIASVTDMTVSILGDGKHELLKHLFLSNILFDIAAIVFINGELLFCLELAGKKLSKSNSRKPGAA